MNRTLWINFPEVFMGKVVLGIRKNGLDTLWGDGSSSDLDVFCIYRLFVIFKIAILHYYSVGVST